MCNLELREVIVNLRSRVRLLTHGAGFPTDPRGTRARSLVATLHPHALRPLAARPTPRFEARLRASHGPGREVASPSRECDSVPRADSWSPCNPRVKGPDAWGPCFNHASGGGGSSLRRATA